MSLQGTFGLALVAVLAATPSRATYSIAACDAVSGQCGVAVQTDNLAVGASVPSVVANVGAIVSQFETHPRHGPRGLELLREERTPAEVLAALLREDDGFEGRGTEARQVAVVAAAGGVAVHTGDAAAASPWAGARTGERYSVQGNGLAGPGVVEAMERAFLETRGPLATRLLAGLVAGDAAGGQRSGRQSAALQVRTPEGFPFDVDLRVDHSSDPVGALQLLYDLLTARQDVIDARISVRRGETAGVRARLIAAVGRASKWPRICVEAAKVALSIEDRSLALQYLALAFARSPERVPVVLGGGDFAELGAEPAFRRWVGEDLRRDVVSDVGSAAGASSPEQPELVVRHVRRLLEVGEAGEALRLLDAAPPPASSGDWLLRAAAHAALGDREAAREACRQGLRESPDDPRLRQRLEALSTGG